MLIVRNIRKLVYSLESKKQMTNFTFSCLVLYLSNLTLDFRYHPEFCKEPIFQLLQKVFQKETDPFNVRNFILLFYNILNNVEFRDCISNSYIIMDKIFKIVNSYELEHPEIQHYALLILSNSSPFLNRLRITNKPNLLINFISLLNQTKNDFLNIVKYIY